MILCPSIQPSTTEEAVKLLGGFRHSAKLVEVRIDTIRDLNFPRLLSSPRPRVIITNRWARDNGSFKGSDAEHFSILSEAVELGSEYIDLELQLGKNIFKKIRDIRKKVKIICSYHDFDKTPRDLSVIYQCMKKLDADIFKIAAMGKSIADNEIIFDLVRKARKDKRKIIGICMGEYGEISRILGGKFGSHLSFVRSSETDPTGPGQLSLASMRNIYRADRVNSSTKIFGLAGNPVRFSRGVLYHNSIFSRHSLNAVYVNFLVDDIEKFMAHIWNYTTGISATMPFKQSIARFVDRFDESVESLGIVNTVVKHRGKLIGYNTDLSAVQKILHRLKVKKDTKVMILGSGNMAKTIAHACNKLGTRTMIVGRNIEKARAIARRYNYDAVTYNEVDNFRPDILINATSVGMGSSFEKPPIPESFLHNTFIVVDVVSNPEGTRLIAEAEKLGCRTVTGGEIFSFQAKLQSSIFTELCR